MNALFKPATPARLALDAAPERILLVVIPFMGHGGQKEIVS